MGNPMVYTWGIYNRLNFLGIHFLVLWQDIIAIRLESLQDLNVTFSS